MSLFESSLKIMFRLLHQVMKSDHKLLGKEHIMNKTLSKRTLRRLCWEDFLVCQARLSAKVLLIGLVEMG